MATKTRKTIGNNPLDAVVPDLRALQKPGVALTESPFQTKNASSIETPRDEGIRKERLTIHLSSALIERVKNAVFWTPGLTLAELGENALSRMVDELEAERGAPFESRTSELKGGRPLKRP